MFYYNLMVTFMRNKTAMSDNLKMIEDKLKEYDVKKLSKSGNLKKKEIFIGILKEIISIDFTS